MSHLFSGLGSGPNLMCACLCPGGTTKLPAAGSEAAAAMPIICDTCPLSWPMLLQGIDISLSLPVVNPHLKADAQQIFSVSACTPQVLPACKSAAQATTLMHEAPASIV